MTAAAACFFPAVSDPPAPSSARPGPSAVVGQRARDEAEATDEALMKAYLAGERLAFRRLFRRLAPPLRAFFLRSFRSPAVADDLLQTTFLKIHAARHRFDVTARVRPWVFTIAARVRLDELRRRYRLPRTVTEETLLDALLVSGEPDARESLEQDERDERIRRAVDALPEGQRVVIHLNRFEGMTFAEVAQVLDMQEGAVRVRAFRAYERLRKSLGDLLRGGEDGAGPAAARSGEARRIPGTSPGGAADPAAGDRSGPLG
jgi:RNA polymerase sigma-70 factor (ECF subfamily)